MPRYRQRAVEVEALKLEYRTLIQTPEGAMSAEAGDYLETIRVGEKVHQRIVPSWVFEIGHQMVKREIKPPMVVLETNMFVAPEECQEMEKVGVQIIPSRLVYTEPHDGYPLTRECIHG